MATHSNTSQDLARLFARKPVVDLPMLKTALDTTSRTTVFRALSAVGYLASYSHAGRFYTLQYIPDFNEDGIWSHRDVLFSRRRTLRATVAHMVVTAPAGQTHAELQARVLLKVHDTLHGLVGGGEIGRVEVERLYLYVSANNEAAELQVGERRRQLLSVDVPVVRLPEPDAVIQILLALIRHPRESVVEIASRVRRHGILQEQVVKVFAHYGLGKKNRAWRRSQP